MKTYTETWTNPKTKKEEEIEVSQYFFEDWESGRIGGNWPCGKHLNHNITENKFFYTLILPEDYDKIRKAQKDLYWQKVANQFKAHKTIFLGTLEKSGNAERLFEIEIKKTETQLFKNKLYDELVVRGNREYQHTNSPNCTISTGAGDYHRITVEALSQYHEWLKEKAEGSSGIKYYNDDPKRGGKRISHYEWLEISGLLEGLEKKGMILNPVHDFDLLKAKRKEQFEKAIKSFKADRKLNKLPTTDFELNCFYIMWLKNEMKVIEGWLTSKLPNGKPKESNSNQIEIMKYNHYVNGEITNAESQLKSPQQSPSISNFKEEVKSSEKPKSFEDLFGEKKWKKYIDALYKVHHPVIDKNYNFIGKPRRDKGVICSWLKDLQNDGIVKRFSRQELASVLNNEIKNLNLGKDGKTFDLVSTAYNEEYKENLYELIR